MPDYPIVIIAWRDALATAEWIEVADTDQANCELVFTCGYLIRETESDYSVAAAVSGTQANAIITIPKAWTQSKKTLKPKT